MIVHSIGLITLTCVCMDMIVRLNHGSNHSVLKRPYYQRFDYQRPLLLGLPKSTNKMLVILHTSCSELTIISLHVVEKTVTNLRVLVETTRAYCFDDPDVVIAGICEGNL